MATSSQDVTSAVQESQRELNGAVSKHPTMTSTYYLRYPHRRSYSTFDTQDNFGSLGGATAVDDLMASTNPVASLVTLTSKDTITTRENKTITLKRGNIAAEKVDIIMNTTGSSMNLSSGGVSKAICTAAEPGLQQNCTRLMTQMGISNVAAGNFIETGPGNLRCQNVFHIVCESFHGANSETLLRSLMQKILQQANQKGIQSIAIPAIGTGHLSFPQDVAAHIMYDEVITFSQQNPEGSLVDVRFVVYHQDQPTFQAFEDEMKADLHVHLQLLRPQQQQEFQQEDGICHRKSL